MRRYRKGQTWRPPSAAESAAHADAVESHRRSPPQPQDLAPVGQHILVKTPEDGIDARDGDTIYHATCTRCIQKNTADEKEIVETDEPLIVYNLQEQDIPGDEYTETALTECGTRYALQAAAQFRQIELKEDFDGPGSVAEAYVLDNSDLTRTETVIEVVCSAADHDGNGSTESGMDGSEEGTGTKGVVAWFGGAWRTIAMECVT